MSKTTYFLAFVAGVAIGSVITWRYTKKKYEQIAQEEIESVKAIFSKREQNPNEELENSGAQMVDYVAKLQKLDYTSHSDISTNDGKEEPPIDWPYVISPDEFGEFDDYEKINLTYYADGVLADDDDEPVDDVEDVVGSESLNHFGEYEDDSVFVRNDRIKCDYEILLDQRNYSDVIETKPYLRAGGS